MPQTDFKLDEGSTAFSEEVQKDISDFLTKKRKEIIYELAGNKKLSHGELAKAVATSVASLSNILIKFEQFKYKLIDSKASGKYRYYYLTELGNSYVERCREDEKGLESEKIIRHEAVRLIQEAKNCLERFQGIHEDDWEIQLDDALIARNKYAEVSKGESEALIDEFLENVEKIMLYNDETLIDKILKLLSDNTILRGRLAMFIDKFTPFCLIITAWEEEENTLQLYDVLEALIENDRTKAKDCAENLGWSYEYDRLSAVISELVEQVKDNSVQDICECFCRYFAGNKKLSAFMSRAVAKAYGNRT